MNPLVDCKFSPNAIRAQQLDLDMRSELAASLRYLVDKCHGEIPFDAQEVNRLADTLQEGALYPAKTFALYYDLVTAIFNDQYDESAELFAKIISDQPLTEKLVTGLDHSIGGPIYSSLMVDEMPQGISFESPSEQVCRRFKENYEGALHLLGAALPELAGELKAIIHEVICVTGSPDDSGEFHGGSHFQLWGALFLNGGLHANRLEMAEVIAHESAHSLLFGFCTQESLVRNPDEELFPSPLRAEPRPMDGVYHATFVSARMHWAMSKLVESGLLTDEEIEFAHEAAAVDAKNFATGFETISAHGDLSQHGRQLIENAHHYICEAA